MKPAQQIAKHSNATTIARKATLAFCLVAVAGLGVGLGGCQALDRAAGVNKRSEFNVRNTEPMPKDRPVDVPKAITVEQQGEELLRQGLKDQALMAFEKAIAENPLAVKSYLNAGEIYFERNDIATAQRRFEAAAKAEPNNFAAHYKNGLMLQLLRRVGESVSAYLKALEINPYDFGANLNVAMAFLQLGEPQQAVRFAEKAVELNTQDDKARANLGAVYAELGRHAEAIAQYREAAQLKDLSPPLLLNLANSLGKTNPPQFAQMLNTLDELLRLDPSTPIAHERRAYALFKLNRREESLSACRAALSLDENHYPAWNVLGYIMINEWVDGKQENDSLRQEALSAWRKSLQIERDQPKIRAVVTTYQ